MRGVTHRRVSVASGACLLLLVVAACSSTGSSLAPPTSTAHRTATPAPAATTTVTRHAVAPRPQHHHRHAPTNSVQGVPAVDLPDPHLTPGAAFAGVTTARVCTPGYASSVRNVPAAEKDEVYAEYRIVHVPLAHEVDHLISLELGGSNDIRNLWPEPYAGRWNARVKDRLENLLHSRVCAGTMALRTAQRLISHDWPAAYRSLIGAPQAAPASPAAPTQPAPAAGGYYTSAYPTARTIYCADDPSWRRLSPTYLRHFATFRAALAAFPGRHLHRPC
jgi:hypothetical protein